MSPVNQELPTSHGVEEMPERMLRAARVGAADAVPLAEDAPRF